MNNKYNDHDSPSDEGRGEGRHSSDRNERPHHSDRKFSKSGDRFDRGGGRGHGGGFDRDRGRGGFDRDRGRGGFDRDRGRGHGGGGFDRDRGGRGSGGSYGRDRGRGPGGGFDRGGGRDGPRGFSKPGRDFSRDRGNNSDSRPSKPWQSNRDERRDSSDRNFATRANAKHEEAGFQLPEQSELPWRTKDIPNVGQNHEMPEHDGETVDLSDLRSQSDEDLAQQALNLKVKNYADAPKAELLFQVGQKLMHAGTALSAAGVVQMVRRDKVNHGYLRFAENSYAVSPGDVYLGVQPDRRNTWKTGDEISCLLNIPDGEDRYFGMRKIEKINGEVPGVQARRTEFKNCKASHPTERFVLERNIRGDENLTGRAIDIFAPIGKGQRGLLVAQPKSGKTVMLQQIAHALVENHPEVELYILLIDERPEEVSEMESKFKNAQVISSTFDEDPSRHAQVAEMALEKACRQVEAGKDVVIMLDSITRLARAHNALQPPGGRTMSGGLDAKALRLPKRFFGAARNIENGGSLTIIATALVKTGSVMDDVIYEEFKGTGNMEIHLDRWLANRECYPAIALNESSTRKSELLFDAKMRKDIAKLRKFTTDAADKRADTVRYSKEAENATRASKYVIGLMKEFDSNAELLEAKLKDPVWKKPGWER